MGAGAGAEMGAGEEASTAGGKGRAEDKEKEKEKGSNKPAKQGRGGARRSRGRGRKGQDGWRKKGEYAKKQDLLHQMKWPKTRRKVKSGGAGGGRGLDIVVWGGGGGREGMDGVSNGWGPAERRVTFKIVCRTLCMTANDSLFRGAWFGCGALSPASASFGFAFFRLSKPAGLARFAGGWVFS